MPLLRTKLCREQHLVQENTLFGAEPSAPQLPVQKMPLLHTKLCQGATFGAGIGV